MNSRYRSVSNRSSQHNKNPLLTHNQPLEIIPPEVVFKDIEINQYYEITIQIRNLTQHSTRIRVAPSASSSISVQYTMQSQIAPGLSTTAKVKYECKELKNQMQIIKIISQEGFTVELPVRVYKMQSQILFEPFVNMGFLRVGKEHVEEILLKNSGRGYSMVDFQVQAGVGGNPMIIQPKQVRIPPMDVAKLLIKYKPTEAGIFKGVVKLKSDSILVKDKIDVHATPVDFSRFIVDDKGGQTLNFDFGTLFVGQQNVVRGFIVNNSPKKMKYRLFYRKGYLSSPEQFTLVQTPSEIGQQQSQRVMFIEPEMGQIQPFAEFELKITCNTRISYRDRIFTKNYALSDTSQQGAINQMKNAVEFKPQCLYEYSVLVNVDEDEPMILQLKANAICPLIKINESTFKFGDCSVKDHKEIQFIVENKNDQTKAEISFPKIPNFYVSPSSLVLRPRQQHTFIAVFEPKTIGKLDTPQILLINKLYELELRFFGISTSGSSKSRLKDIPIQSGTIPNKQSPKKLKQPFGKSRGKAFSLTDKTFMSQMRKSTQQEEHMKLELSYLMDNRSKYNQYLVDKRTERFDKQKDENVQKRWSLYQSKLKDIGKHEERVDDQGLSANPPIDYEFETGMLNTKLSKQKINLPEAKQRLYVTRHISDYEPLPVTNSNTEKYFRDFKQVPKRLWPEIPQNYNHKREVGMQLTAQELSQIQVASNTINFGEVYIKSISKGYFWIKNSTKKTISVELKYNDNQLKLSNKNVQVIPSSHQAGFQICFNKDTLGDFRSTIKYFINSQHQFEMSITAKCVPVNIQIDSTNIKFSFEENSLDMTTKEVIRLTNPGNSEAVFKFTLAKQRLFIPQIIEGKLKQKQTLEIPIKFTAPQPKTQKSEYVFNERLILKILDGSQSSIMCNCHLYDPKFTVKPLTTINPTLCIGHQYSDFIEVKNTSKYPIVLHINGKILQINEKVKINPDDTKKFRVRYQSKQIGQFLGEVIIVPRCGIKKVLETKIKVIEPNLTFGKSQTDMGVLVVQGISGVGKMKLKNQSGIDMPLIIDLRPRHIKDTNPKHIQNLSIKLINSEDQLDVVGPTIPNEIQRNQLIEGQNLVDMEINEEQLDDNSQADEEEIVQKNQEEYRRYRLLLKPDHQYQFQLEFFPKQVGHYEIIIPMQIQGSQATIRNIPALICEGIKPQFVFEPSCVDFKRKIVTKPQRSYPKFMNITISNIDDVQVTWQLKDFEIRKQGIFSIQKNQGRLKPKQTIEVRASFNPFTVGQYSYKMPLFIKNSKLTQPLKYVDVIFKGVSSLPNLFFNKRQVIMPVVPIDLQTTSTFKILNDGYENCNLKYQFIDDVAELGVKVVFPEGTNIGITRQKLKVDLIWKYHKPISFCLKLEFIDDLNRSFVIPISGTSDNCIFTNYTYFLRNQNKFTIKSQGPLKLVQNVQPTGLVRKGSAHSIRSNMTGRSVMSYLGVNPISPAILSSTINYINRYLNSNLLTNPIKDFPGSFIENDGQQIFEVLAFVSSKPQNFPWKYNPIANEKSVAKVNRLFNQYNQLIKLLKIQGAHLNHIRPEYLLSFTDLNLYLGNLPEQRSKFYMPSLLKINSGLYNYLSLQSWITLLYQIFKIYILARVSPKNFKSHLPSIAEPPKYSLQQSNFISTSQALLFYWVENAILQILLEERRLTNFDKDLKDGIAIAALLQKYAGITVLKKMKMICVTEDDFKENAVVVCEGLKQIGMLNHITPNDINNPLQRQMLLFILHLYVYLPFYVPKQQPVVFKCILGQQVVRTIQLTNPSTKPVTYNVKYQGSQDFKMISEAKFRIEPKQVYKFQVKFVSRISAPVKGKIMFINVKQNSLTAAALVFQLQSNIVGRTSDRIWNISGLLYEQVQFPIEVYNKFTTAELVDFTISYQTQYIFDTKIKSKNNISPLPKEQQTQTIYGKQDNVKIRKNGTATLTLNYIPMAFYTTKTTIFFLNPIIGQFQHQIIASVEPPGTTAQIRPPMTLSVDQIVNWEYSLNSKNDQIARCKKAIQSLKKTKKGSVNAGQKDTQSKTQTTFISENFTVQIPPNPYLTAKQHIIICDKRQEKKSKEDLIQTDNKIPFTIICKNPVYEFTTFALVFNKTKTDVRRFKIIFTVQPKALKAILEMTVPARGEVTQNLPIVNNTERDWNIKVQWQPDTAKNGNYFIVPSQNTSSFPVKRNSIGNFSITFKPKWANSAEAKLILTNPLTLDHFQYQIIGKGQQPLAQQHIQIKCEAKQTVKKQIIVKNPYQEKPVTLNVQTDLINCKAPKKITIPSGGKQKLQFSVQPMLCGEYTGSITLFEDDGPQYLWYTVSIITNYPEAFKVLSITSQIRQKVLTEIHVPYEHNQQASFQVVINGIGLLGDPTCTMKPNYDNIYLLEYLPLEIGDDKGSVCFINPGVGQVLFQINLVCSNKQPVIINNLKSPLGVSTIIYAELENPTQSKTIVKVTNTNPEQFVMKSHSFKLQALEKKKVQIQYVPASLDNLESTRIQFISKDIGDWKYQLSGTGQMPVPFSSLNVYNGLYEEHSDSIKFKNPFKYEIVVGVKLVDESQKGIFKIMAHGKTKFQIDMGGVLQIPFSFIPGACKLYTCKILIMISQKIYWTFPIRGVTEVNQGKVIASLTSPCRQTTSEFVQVALQGVEYTSKNNIFEYSFENIPSHYQKLIEKALLVQLTKDNLKHAKDTLQLQFIFKPLKPIKVSFDLLITKKQGSRWRYRLVLEGTQPEVDDFIEIQSNLLVTSTVAFKITNTQKTSSPYKAKFTSDSAHQFSIQPKQGILAPFGTKGTSFYVSYTPVEYGKQKKGKLIIQTADMYWSYLLKGSLPKYIPPKLEGSRSRISSLRK